MFFDIVIAFQKLTMAQQFLTITVPAMLFAMAAYTFYSWSWNKGFNSGHKRGTEFAKQAGLAESKAKDTQFNTYVMIKHWLKNYLNGFIEKGNMVVIDLGDSTSTGIYMILIASDLVGHDGVRLGTQNKLAYVSIGTTYIQLESIGFGSNDCLDENTPYVQPLDDNGKKRVVRKLEEYIIAIHRTTRGLRVEV